MLCYEGKKVYFFDPTALNHLANALQGNFLDGAFGLNFLNRDENVLFVTDAESFERIQAMKTDGTNGINEDFKEFIINHFTIIPRDKAIDALNKENALKRYYIGSIIIFNDEPFAGAFGGLLYLYKEEKVEPILVTFEPEVERVAKELGFRTL